jgi:hypothetical protein
MPTVWNVTLATIFRTFEERSKGNWCHFNNHEFCDEWCSMKADVTQAATGNPVSVRRPRCSVQTGHRNHGSIVNTEKLKECHHGFSSQNESMNRLISRYVPKDRTFCQSPLTSRICWPLSRQCRPRQVLWAPSRMNIKLPRNTVIMLGNMGKKRHDKLYQAQPHKRKERTWSS